MQMNAKYCSTFLAVAVGKGTLWEALLWSVSAGARNLPKSSLYALWGKLTEEKLNILLKTLSKQCACKIVIPDIAVLLCVEVVPNKL